MKHRSLTLVILIILISTLLFSLWYFLNDNTQNSKVFGIYLIENDKQIIFDEDIVTYNKQTHEIIFEENSLVELKNLNIPIDGIPFSLRIDGEEIFKETIEWCKS